MLSGLERRRDEHLVGAVVGGCLLLGFAASSALALLQPLSGAEHYWIAVRLAVLLGAIWALWLLRPGAMRSGWLLAPVLVAGVAIGTLGLGTVNADSEMVHVYQSTFEVLEDGGNPYTAETVYHRDGSGAEVTGTFNYPPLELYPAWVAYRLAGHWDAGVLTAMIVSLNLLAGALLLVAFRSEALWVLPWLPLVVLFDVKSNISMTLLLVVLVLWALKAGGPDPTWPHRVLVAALFGLGLTTKFLLIPLFAAYAWHHLARPRVHGLQKAEADVAIALAVALAVVAPFGATNVLRSTIGFNLLLGDRSELTTFYPNALSGVCSALGLPGAYAVLAVVGLGAAVLLGRHVERDLAMVATVTAFLLVAPTPEPQYLPVVLVLVLGLTWWRWELEAGSGAGQVALARSAGRPTGVGVAPAGSPSAVEQAAHHRPATA